MEQGKHYIVTNWNTDLPKARMYVWTDMVTDNKVVGHGQNTKGRTMETAVDTNALLEELMMQAYERGREKGRNDYLQGYENDSPLSGEWAGESIAELLGDLISKAEKLSGEDSEIAQDICDNYETGYLDTNCD